MQLDNSVLFDSKKYVLSENVTMNFTFGQLQLEKLC